MKNKNLKLLSGLVAFSLVVVIGCSQTTMSETKVTRNTEESHSELSDHQEESTEGSSEPTVPFTAPYTNSSYSHPTRTTRLFVKYWVKTAEGNLNLKVYDRKQVLTGESYDEKKIGADFSFYGRKSESHPLHLSISNVWSLWDKEKPARISLPLSFMQTKLISGRTYRCTQNYQDPECRVQLFDFDVDLKVPVTDETVCKVKIETKRNLDFPKRQSGLITGVSIPPAVFEKEAEVEMPFAVSFQCQNPSDDKLSMIDGYFLYNTEKAPQL